MRYTLLVILALAAAPAVAHAQGGADSARRTTPADSARPRRAVTPSASGGEVAQPGAEAAPGVTPAMRKAQENPRLIGSPAWWRTHATADGQPLGRESQAERRKTQTTPRERPPR